MNDESIDLENYFAPGKLVNLTTRHDDQITGNIMAFDLPTSMIVLQSDVDQVVCVNLKNIKFINAEDTKEQIKQLDFKTSLSVPKLRQRLEDAVEDKKSLAQDTAGNSPIGQKLIMCLNRMLKCKWSGQNIVVVDSKIEIHAPYRASDIQILPGGNEHGRDRVIKIINRFYETNGSN